MRQRSPRSSTAWRRSKSSSSVVERGRPHPGLPLSFQQPGTKVACWSHRGVFFLLGRTHLRPGMWLCIGSGEGFQAGAATRQGFKSKFQQTLAHLAVSGSSHVWARGLRSRPPLIRAAGSGVTPRKNGGNLGLHGQKLKGGDYPVFRTRFSAISFTYLCTRALRAMGPAGRFCRFRQAN